MTFRPSVLPDRDNDIISTFTRSFERARNLVRADQANAREQKAFEQESRLRAFDIEDREFDAAIRQTQPGVTPAGGARAPAFPTGAAEPIGDAFQQPPVSGGGDLGVQIGEVPDFGGGREDQPGVGGVGVITEPAPRGDTVDLPGGGTFSRSLQTSILEAEQERETRRAADVQFDLPEARHERTIEERETIVETAERQREITKREGQARAFRSLFPEIPDDLGTDAVIQMGEVLEARALRETPTGASVVSAQGRTDRGVANVLAIFERTRAAAVSAAGRQEPTPQQRLESLQSGVPFAGDAVEDDLLMDRAITSALTAGTITPDQAATMQNRVQELLAQAGVGGATAGPLSEEDVAFFLEDAAGSVEQRVSQWRMDGLDDEAIAQLVAASGGR
jgi:hypothetical protein